MANHVLKIWPSYYHDVQSGRKPWEIRYNDRDFRIGDTITFHEWAPASKHFTGSPTFSRQIVYILHGPAFGLREGYVCMTLR